MSKLPLKGVKVCDFTWVWTGPTTTKVLSDFGATVVNIESKKRLGTWRIQPPFKDNVPGPNRGAVFNIINTGKYGVTIDVSNPKGKELAKRLVAWADIVADNFAGGAMERMGLGYEELKKIKPDIIMMSSSMMGQTGPWYNQPGYGDLLSAISGVHQISGWPDRPPAEIGYYTDYVAPRFNALTILAALDYRRRTGKGQYLDMAQHQGGLHYVGPLLLDYEVNKRVAARRGNKDDFAAPHGSYRCRGEDRWCVIAVSTNEEWQGFCNVIGNPDWTKDSRFATLEKRQENEEELDYLVQAWTINQDDRNVMYWMQAEGVPAGTIGDPEDYLEYDPQLKYRHFYYELGHPEIGRYRAPRQPCVLSKTPCEIRRAHCIGEHNDIVFKDFLGMTDDEIAELVIEEVIY